MGQRTEEQWLDIARYVRHAVNKVAAAPLPLCLPGEPQECGQTAREHALGWSAELKATAHHLIEESASTREEAEYYAATYYKDRVTSLRQPQQQSA